MRAQNLEPDKALNLLVRNGNKKLFLEFGYSLMRLVLLLLCIVIFSSCASSGEKVVKPRTHKMWAKGNKYVIDIPVGARHIQLFERKRTKTVRMR
jgi:hypothetical protein